MKFNYLIMAFTFALCCISKSSFSQSPLAIPYQAIARDSAGNLLQNHTIAMRFSLHNQTANGVVLYKESQLVTTNALGLFTVNIGTGTVITGTTLSIDWDNGPKFIEVEMDVNGGSNFISMGTTQLMSVPYALYARKCGDLPTIAANGNTMHWNGAKWEADNAIYNNGTNIGIGTTSPTQQLHTTEGVRFQKFSGHSTRALLVDSSGNLMASTGDSVNTKTSTASVGIPDNACTPSATAIYVSGYPIVTSSSISVRINITHTYDGDLYIYLKAPNGEVVNLAHADGGSGDNFTNTVFSSSALFMLGSSTPPFTGTFKPTGNPVSPCANYAPPIIRSDINQLGYGMIDPNGFWQLEVMDLNGADVGSITGWDLYIDMNDSKNNRIPKWENGNLVQSNIFSTGGKTGIGTPVPMAILDVNGDALIGGVMIGSSPGGGGNTRVGYASLAFNAGSDNTAIGLNTLHNNISGSNNTTLGSSAMANNQTGSYNTAIGMESGLGNTGNYNTYLGYQSKALNPGVHFATGIGAGAVVTTSNTTIIGGPNGSAFVTNVGIGLTNPSDKLDVNGAIRSQVGYRCKAGTNFGFGTNLYNFYWTGSALQCWIDGSLVGNVSGLSDRRLKDQISPMNDNALARVMKLKPVNFHYKTVEGTVFKENPQLQEGFIADELQEVIPSAVMGEKNAVTEDGKIQPQSLNLGPVISVLTKAIQEQQLQIETQQKQIEELTKLIKNEGLKMK